LKPNIKITFRYFWKGFSKESNIFVELLTSYIKENSVNVNFEFHSVFGKPRRLNTLRRNARKVIIRVKNRLTCTRTILIWYTGENIKPPKGYDITLSFESTGGTNLYWPLWATYINLYGNSTSKDREYLPTLDVLLERRSIDLTRKKLKGVMLLSDKHDTRYQLGRRLEDLNMVDTFGSGFGRPVVSKAELAKKYLFQICFESSLQEGYVTEKVIEAWLAESVPVYRGIERDEYLNGKAFIQCYGLSDDQIIRQVGELISNPELAKELLEEPILLKPFDFNRFFEILESVLKK
jgi:alpha(1,3/1,4) fucosyltransferase